MEADWPFRNMGSLLPDGVSLPGCRSDKLFLPGMRLYTRGSCLVTWQFAAIFSLSAFGSPSNDNGISVHTFACYEKGGEKNCMGADKHSSCVKYSAVYFQACKVPKNVSCALCGIRHAGVLPKSLQAQIKNWR